MNIWWILVYNRAKKWIKSSKSIKINTNVFYYLFNFMKINLKLCNLHKPQKRLKQAKNKIFNSVKKLKLFWKNFYTLILHIYCTARLRPQQPDRPARPAPQHCTADYNHIRKAPPNCAGRATIAIKRPDLPCIQFLRVSNVISLLNHKTRYKPNKTILEYMQGWTRRGICYDMILLLYAVFLW